MLETQGKQPFGKNNNTQQRNNQTYAVFLDSNYKARHNNNELEISTLNK